MRNGAIFIVHITVNQLDPLMTVLGPSWAHIHYTWGYWDSICRLGAICEIRCQVCDEIRDSSQSNATSFDEDCIQINSVLYATTLTGYAFGQLCGSRWLELYLSIDGRINGLTDIYTELCSFGGISISCCLGGFGLVIDSSTNLLLVWLGWLPQIWWQDRCEQLRYCIPLTLGH